MGDLRVRASMFDGRGVIEISAQSLKVTFTGLRSDNDVLIARVCATLAERAIRSVSDDFLAAVTVLGLTLQLKLDGGEDAVNAMLQRVTNVDMKLDDDGVDIKQWLALHLNNTRQGWQSFVNVQHLLDHAGILLMNMHSIYDVTGAFQSLETQAAHAEKLLETLWKNLCLEREAAGSA